jgi:hypothetical protein
MLQLVKAALESVLFFNAPPAVGGGGGGGGDLVLCDLFLEESWWFVL